MDIHKPKPWHGVREFLKEYVIIVVGVLTALGAEQAVEWLHWRHEIADSRQALGVELANNLRAVRSIEGENACIRARLDTLQAWANGQGARPPGPVLSPVFFFISNTTWEVTNSAQALAHFPLDLRRNSSTARACMDGLATRAGQSRTNVRRGSGWWRSPTSHGSKARTCGDCAKPLALRGSPTHVGEGTLRGCRIPPDRLPGATRTRPCLAPRATSSPTAAIPVRRLLM